MAISWRRNQPMVKYLKRWLPRMFPLIKKVGGYANRTTARGSFSAHSEGRAADIYLRANIPEQKALGDALFKMFRERSRELGVHHVIWNRQIWSARRGGPRPYGGGSHRDHVHVAFTRVASQKQPSILIPLLDGIHIGLYGKLSGEP